MFFSYFFLFLFIYFLKHYSRAQGWIWRFFPLTFLKKLPLPIFYIFKMMNFLGTDIYFHCFQREETHEELYSYFYWNERNLLWILISFRRVSPRYNRYHLTYIYYYYYGYTFSLGYNFGRILNLCMWNIHHSHLLAIPTWPSCSSIIIYLS